MARRIALLAVLFLCSFGQLSAQMGANLCPPTSATDTAKQSGSWQDATTWTDGTIPVDGERVLVPIGVAVQLHGTTADVEWIHVAGTLEPCHCDNPTDTQLNVHTVYVPMGGSFRFGMPGKPFTAKLIVEFIPGPFLPGDTTKLSRGVINHGEFTVCGNEKTAWDVIDDELPIGATSLKTKNVPYGWKIGDKILIAGTDSPRNGVKYQTEERTITAINGRTVIWAEPLLYRHWQWRADLPFHCANITRNIVFRSRDTSTIENRGHIMSMSAGMNLFWCAGVNGGRTDKSQPVTDPRFDTYGELIAGSDANTRARYIFHWHRVGVMGPPSFCVGVVADGSPGWGIVNHASNVHCDDAICVRCFGSGFTTEEGQERGAFRRCLAALNIGLGETMDDGAGSWGRREIGDWGIAGSGFWLQGGLVEVSDCVSFDNSDRGFFLFNSPLNNSPEVGSTAEWLRSLKIEVDKSLLPEEYQQTAWWEYRNPAAIPSGFVPQRVFARNVAYNNRSGLQVLFVQNRTNMESKLTLPVAVRGSIQDFTTWGRGAQADLEYTRQINVDGLKVINDTLFRTGTIKQRSGLIIRFPEVTVRGYEFVGSSRLTHLNPTDPTHVVEP